MGPLRVSLGSTLKKWISISFGYQQGANDYYNISKREQQLSKNMNRKN
jgi:hypothetical protein